MATAAAASKIANMSRKQEEKNLGILRGLCSLEENKFCFDCHQRGPTYVNMTIGSFVCTSCSGILRGLNPPHRVKSISMTSFTSDDIDFIMSRGNSLCSKVWLGLFDHRSLSASDSRDETKIRELMSHKYDKKRWYLQPTEQAYEDARNRNIIAAQEPKPSKCAIVVPTVSSVKTQQMMKVGDDGVMRSRSPSDSGVGEEMGGGGLQNSECESDRTSKTFDQLTDDFCKCDISGDLSDGGFADFSQFPETGCSYESVTVGPRIPPPPPPSSCSVSSSVTHQAVNLASVQPSSQGLDLLLSTPSLIDEPSPTVTPLNHIPLLPPSSDVTPLQNIISPTSTVTPFNNIPLLSPTTTVTTFHNILSPTSTVIPFNNIPVLSPASGVNPFNNTPVTSSSTVDCVTHGSDKYAALAELDGLLGSSTGIGTAIDWDNRFRKHASDMTHQKGCGDSWGSDATKEVPPVCSSQSKHQSSVEQYSQCMSGAQASMSGAQVSVSGVHPVMSGVSGIPGGVSGMEACMSGAQMGWGQRFCSSVHQPYLYPATSPTNGAWTGQWQMNGSGANAGVGMLHHSVVTGRPADPHNSMVMNGGGEGNNSYLQQSKFAVPQAYQLNSAGFAVPQQYQQQPNAAGFAVPQQYLQQPNYAGFAVPQQYQQQPNSAGFAVPQQYQQQPNSAGFGVAQAHQLNATVSQQNQQHPNRSGLNSNMVCGSWQFSKS